MGGIKAEIIIVVIREFPISRYHSCPKSANYYRIGIKLRIEYSRSAFVKSSKIPVFTYEVTNTIVIISIVLMLTVSRPIYSISLVLIVLSTILTTEIKMATDFPKTAPSIVLLTYDLHKDFSFSTLPESSNMLQ